MKAKLRLSRTRLLGGEGGGGGGVFKCRQTRQEMSESNFWAGRAMQGQVGGVEDGS